MSSISACELLNIIRYQWAGTKEIMKIGNVGENRALRIKKEIAYDLINKGYALPSNKVPMEAVIEYFKINIEYLEMVNKERKK